MDKIFKPVLGRCLWVYLDDLIVFSKTKEQHLRDLEEVLSIIRDNKLYLAEAKCEFARDTLKFLGHVVSPGRISADSDKTEVVREWPIPSTVRELQSFLGLTNYYRRFIRNYAYIASPLTDLTGGPEGSQRKLQWSPEADKAFRRLKEALSSAPVLGMPLQGRPYHVLCDASDVAVGAILEQDGKPVAFVSKRLSAAETNYSIRDKELLAVTHALRQFRVYLLGAPFTVSTDHESLKYLLSQKELTGRLARWAESLADFDLRIEHIRGRDNPADVLSRPPPTMSSPAVASSDVAAVRTMVSASSSPASPDHLGADVSDDDAYFGPIIAALKTAAASGEGVKGPSQLRQRAERFVLSEDGVLFLREGRRRCVIGERERLLLLQEAHDAKAAGHQGVERTAGRLVTMAFWPGMVEDAKKFVNSCDLCQRNKTVPHPPRAPHEPSEVPSRPWEVVSMDFTAMPRSLRGNDSLFVVNDMFSGLLHLIPTSSTADAPTVALLFINEIFKHHGLPTSIISDRDSRFTGEVWKAIWESLGTRLRMSVAHRPQADGATERANRTIQEALRACVNSLGSNWDDPAILAPVEFALNSAKKAGSRLSAFQVASGLSPRSPLDLLSSPTSPLGSGQGERSPSSAADIANSLRLRLTMAKDALHKKKEEQTAMAEKRKPPHEVPFKINDLVLLSTKNYPHLQAHKLAPKFVGPFRIKSVRGSSIALDLPARFRIHPTVNEESIRIFTPPAASPWPSRTQPPPPPLVDPQGHPMFIMERFLQERTHRGRRQILVRWKGYGPEEDSWEPYEAVVPQSPLLLEQFRASVPAPAAAPPPRPQRGQRRRGG
jgi:hypothetical protein